MQDKRRVLILSIIVLTIALPWEDTLPRWVADVIYAGQEVY